VCVGTVKCAGLPEVTDVSCSPWLRAPCPFAPCMVAAVSSCTPPSVGRSACASWSETTRWVAVNDVSPPPLPPCVDCSGVRRDHASCCRSTLALGPSTPLQGMVLAVKRSISLARHTLLASRLRACVEEGVCADAMGLGPGPGASVIDAAGMPDQAQVLHALVALYDVLGLEQAVVVGR
jgi:hypothetical protein